MKVNDLSWLQKLCEGDVVGSEQIDGFEDLHFVSTTDASTITCGNLVFSKFDGERLDGDGRKISKDDPGFKRLVPETNLMKLHVRRRVITERLKKIDFNLLSMEALEEINTIIPFQPAKN